MRLIVFALVLAGVARAEETKTQSGPVIVMEACPPGEAWNGEFCVDEIEIWELCETLKCDSDFDSVADWDWGGGGGSEPGEPDCGMCDEFETCDDKALDTYDTCMDDVLGGVLFTCAAEASELYPGASLDDGAYEDAWSACVERETPLWEQDCEESWWYDAIHCEAWYPCDASCGVKSCSTTHPIRQWRDVVMLERPSAVV